MTMSGSLNGTLSFGSGGLITLFLGGFTPGRRQWRRRVVSSDYSPGEYETAAVLDQTRDMTLRFRVKGANEAAVQSNVLAILNVVELATWTFDITINSSAWPTLTCTRADSDVIFDAAHLRGPVATVDVYTTHQPNTSGPL